MVRSWADRESDRASRNGAQDSMYVAGIIAVELDEGDFLVGVALTGGKHDVMLFSDAGKAVRFREGDVRPMGRVSRGVRGMRLAEGQRVISMLTAEDESASVLTATENGYGKRTPISDYPRHGRGTQGVIGIDASDRNGRLVAATLVSAADEVMLITTGGVLIRTRVDEIREMSRATQGVTLIKLGKEEKLAGLQKVIETEESNGDVDVMIEAADAVDPVPSADLADSDGQVEGGSIDGNLNDGGEDGTSI